VCLLRVVWREPIGERFDCGYQFSRIDGLGKVNLEACSERLYAIFGSGVCRQSRGLHPSDEGIVMAAYPRNQLKSVEHRHS